MCAIIQSPTAVSVMVDKSHHVSEHQVYPLEKENHDIRVTGYLGTQMNPAHEHPFPCFSCCWLALQGKGMSPAIE